MNRSVESARLFTFRPTTALRVALVRINVIGHTPVVPGGL
jgi:hypothetical protein